MIFGKNMNRNNYIEFLQQNLVPAIQALQQPHHLIFVHDSCLANGSAEVTTLFNNALGNNRIGIANGQQDHQTQTLLTSSPRVTT